MKQKRRGQAIIEYLLMVIMLAVTVAVAIRGSNRTIYQLWTGLVRQVAKGCPDCDAPDAPDFQSGAAQLNQPH